MELSGSAAFDLSPLAQEPFSRTGINLFQIKATRVLIGYELLMCKPLNLWPLPWLSCFIHEIKFVPFLYIMIMALVKECDKFELIQLLVLTMTKDRE